MTTPLLTVGKPKGDEVGIDLATLLETRLLLQGSSGAGKTWALFWLLQATFGKVQQLVIDREGEFSGLRKEYPYLLAGPEGDIPVHLPSAALLVRRILELRVSTIIDLSELNLDDQREYVRRVAHELAHLPRTSGLWTSLLVAIDEIHVFGPEAGKGKAPASLAALGDLASLGRKRGFCLLGVTTRLARLDKDIAALLENKLIGRTGDVDAKRAAEELDFDKKGRRELRSLDLGHFWAYGPAIAIDPVLVRTSGELTVKPPKRGELREPPPPASAKIQKLKEQLRDLPQQAQAEARTMEELRQRNAELERQIKKAERGALERIVEKKVVDQDAIDAAVKRALADAIKPVQQKQRALFKAIGAAATTLRKTHAGLQQCAQEVDAIAATLAKMPESEEYAAPLALVSAAPTGRTPSPTLVARTDTVSASLRAIERERRTPVASDGTLSDPERRILNAAAAFEQLGIAPVRRVNVAFFAGYTENGHFNNMVGALRTKGLLDYPTGGLVQLTDEGRRQADPDAQPIASRDDLHRAWLAKLSEPQRRLLRVLIEEYPNPVSRAELATRCGYTENGHFNNTVGSLRTLGAADYPQQGMVAATDVLFPEGLA